jgi:hypothetical protein
MDKEVETLHLPYFKNKARFAIEEGKIKLPTFKFTGIGISSPK